VSRRRGPADAVTATLLRNCLIALAALNTAGIAVELASLRHWKTPVQMIPWVTVVVIAVCIGLLVPRPTRGSVHTVRILAALVVVSALFGMYEHIAANYRAGPLDFRFADHWAAMPLAARLWASLTGAVGPAQAFVPGVMAFGATCLWFATLRHPALLSSGSGRSGRPAGRGMPGGGEVIRTPSFAISLDRRAVATRDGRMIRPAPVEWRLLEVLARNPGTLLSEALLMYQLWGTASGQHRQRLRIAMVRLQRDLEPDPSRPVHLLTQPDAGYWFDPGSDASRA
jgi:DNA-binding winged helix-turn-helix (wHTH) protein